MPIFASFVMGPKETYFFNTPTHWAWHNLPPDIEALFTKSPPIKDVLELAISDKETYFISYRDHDSQVLCKHYNLPNPLTEWLYASHPSIIRDLPTLSITLGPYESYYAWDKSNASWSNLPPSLEKAVLARLETQDKWKTVWKAGGAEAPSFVCLGADGAYFMRTVSGGGCWDLKCGTKGDGREGTEGIRGSNGFLEECRDFNGVAALHLFPSHPTSYILILTTGKAFSNLPECTWPDYNKLSPALPTFVQSEQPIPPIPQPAQKQGQLPQQQPPQQQLQQRVIQPQQPGNSMQMYPQMYPQPQQMPYQQHYPQMYPQQPYAPQHFPQPQYVQHQYPPQQMQPQRQAAPPYGAPQQGYAPAAQYQAGGYQAGQQSGVTYR